MVSRKHPCLKRFGPPPPNTRICTTTKCRLEVRGYICSICSVPATTLLTKYRYIESVSSAESWTRKWVSNGYERCSCCCCCCCCCCCFLFLLSDFQCTEAFSFHKRSSLNFAHTLVTIFSTIAPCRIFKLSPN